MSKKFIVIYGILFLALLVQPHIIKGHIAGLEAAYLQSLVIVLITSLLVLTYSLHMRDIKEKQRLKEEQTRTLHHLTDMSAELGLANRRLPLLHELTTKILAKEKSARKHKQALMEHLLGTLVVSLSQSDWGVFRFVDTKEGRTVGEFILRYRNSPPPSVIGNKALMELSKESNTGENTVKIVTTSDKTAGVRCYFIMPHAAGAGRHDAFIQNIVDQAQIIYQYLYKNDFVKERGVNHYGV